METNAMGANKPKMSLKKKLLSVFFVLAGLAVLCVCVLFGLNEMVKAQAAPYFRTAAELNQAQPADCVLVLGCLAYDDGRLSPMLQDRVDQGIALYKAGAAKKILMSGDHGQTDYDEVNAMKAYAMEQGVPSEDIFMDHAGFSTYESMYRAKTVFSVSSCIVVTQKYHLYRAVYDARALGLTAYGVSSDPRLYGNETSRNLRELLARNKDVFFTLFRVKPTYLGSVISIAGNGNTTNDKPL